MREFVDEGLDTLAVGGWRLRVAMGWESVSGRGRECSFGVGRAVG